MKSLAVVFFLTPLLLWAKDEPKYPISAIPAGLADNVSAVQRLHSTSFQVLSINKCTEHITYVCSILNSNGKMFARQVFQYNAKLDKVVSVKGNVYDAYGNLIKKLKANEVYDQAAYDGYSLFSDSRLKAVDLAMGTYPYTVEIEYVIEHRYLYWMPTVGVGSESTTIEKATYDITYPLTLKPRYKVFNGLAEPKVKSDGTNETMSWSFENVPVTKSEPFSSEFESTQYALITPVDFEYDGYSGRKDSWNSLGKWAVQLNAGRNILPPETKAKIVEITKGLKTDLEKIDAVYSYLQNTTRYVSIQRGIGGFQPFEASLVAKVGYGDCKALSNYMVAMLKEAGVKGYYTEIQAGAEGAYPLTSDFPFDPFNHIVVAVPMANDTLWLECTSQTSPLGYMGRFTGDRKALMITDDGGALVRTPRYDEKTNLQKTRATVQVKLDGSAVAQATTSSSGIQYENGHLNHYLNSSAEEQKKWLQENIRIPSFDIIKFSMSNKKTRIPEATVSVNLNIPRFASVSGKRIFITPNLLNKSTFIPEKVENRKTQVQIKTGYIDTDTIEYVIPEELYPEGTPAPVHFENEFGSYDASFMFDQGKMVYIRRCMLKKGTYSPEKYAELIQFYKQVNKADNTKVVFLNKT